MTKQVKINPRSRYVKPLLASIVRNARIAQYTWNQPRSEWNAQIARHEHVPTDQQPENVAADWLSLYERMEAIEREAGTVRKLAARMVRQLAGDDD